LIIWFLFGSSTEGGSQEVQMLFDECGDEIVGVVVPILQQTNTRRSDSGKTLHYDLQNCDHAKASHCFVTIAYGP
jgi:hypothetical protein